MDVADLEKKAEKENISNRWRSVSKGSSGSRFSATSKGSSSKQSSEPRRPSRSLLQLLSARRPSITSVRSISSGMPSEQAPQVKPDERQKNPHSGTFGLQLFTRHTTGSTTRTTISSLAAFNKEADDAHVPRELESHGQQREDPQTLLASGSSSKMKPTIARASCKSRSQAAITVTTI
eukprot:gnl/TRDRNA2_/TRDRNA2_76387_c0_seq1.p1 gnl/TRDRNA2_/TRDRNA2_76387_c0~~gnl/TRDRNA2_/TRDRNA2_76387_c0_seq1.p1  ORF type:complete len:197 (-),score=24.25 gnl/TRDRNA2_/TRDRNA2_76387_c0_seq1:106-639(-)